MYFEEHLTFPDSTLQQRERYSFMFHRNGETNVPLISEYFSWECETFRTSAERTTLLTELLFGFVKALLPTRALVRFREHDGYILDPGSVNKARTTT